MSLYLKRASGRVASRSRQARVTAASYPDQGVFRSRLGRNPE